MAVLATNMINQKLPLGISQRPSLPSAINSRCQLDNPTTTIDAPSPGWTVVWFEVWVPVVGSRGATSRAAQPPPAVTKPYGASGHCRQCTRPARQLPAPPQAHHIPSSPRPFLPPSRSQITLRLSSHTACKASVLAHRSSPKMVRPQAHEAEAGPPPPLPPLCAVARRSDEQRLT